MKTRIYQEPNGNVTVESDDLFTGDRSTVTYFCPGSGGYVRIADGNRYPQVCEKLYSRGPTLMCSSADDLLRVIRREYRRARNIEKRELTKW